VATASGSCNKGELLAKGFAGCLFKPFSISELMEVSDKCAIKATPDGEPDFSALLSYGNEAVMLDKLMTETEKEMQAVQDAAIEKDLQKLDSLTHHLRSSWEVLRADQPLRELYGLLHGDTLPDGEALSRAVTAVLEKGAEIIRLAEKERRKAMQLDMTKGKILPVILKFTIPLIIGNIFQQLYNMVDTIIVGRYVGADALAAVGSTGTIMFLIIGFAQGITAGFSILISQKYGGQNIQGVKRSAANGILLSIFSSIILTILCLVIMKPLLKLMNTPDNIFQDAYAYIMIISVGITANIFYNLFSAYLRAVGNSKIPLFFHA